MSPGLDGGLALAGGAASAGSGARAGAEAASLAPSALRRARPRARSPQSADRPHAVSPAMTGYARSEAEFAAGYRRDARPASLAPKDYSVPLHVDCSIEYELPDCAKPPQGVKIEPLLMIHPSHFRRLESLRRVPFVNNLPRDAVSASAAAAAPARRVARPPRRCCRAAPAPSVAPPAPAAAARARAPEEPAPCYRFDSYALEAGKLGRARLKAHPYLPVDCDMARLPAPYERFDKRALQQLPIYM